MRPYHWNFRLDLPRIVSKPTFW